MISFLVNLIFLIPPVRRFISGKASFRGAGTIIIEHPEFGAEVDYFPSRCVFSFVITIEMGNMPSIGHGAYKYGLDESNKFALRQNVLRKCRNKFVTDNGL
jgi:hypothetical protein